MTDQKPPAPVNNPTPSPVKPAGPAPVPPAALPPVPGKQVPPPLPKPNFSVNPGAPKPPAPAPVPTAPAAPAAKPAAPAVPPASAPKPAVLPPKPVGAPPAPSLPPSPPKQGLPQAKPAVSPAAPVRPPAPKAAAPTEGLPPASTIRQAPRPASPAPAALPPKPGLPQAKPLAGTPLVAKPMPNDAQATGAPPAPKQAEVKKSVLRFLPILLLVLVVLGVAGFLISRVLAPKTTTTTIPTGSQNASAKATTTITYWGLWEPSPVLKDTLADFEAQNPGIKVNYQQQTYRDYRERLQAAIAGGKGPDVFRFHASWVPMLRSELSEMPATVFTPSQFQQTFFPVASEQLLMSGKVYGVPLMYDGLALIYNKEVFNTANAQPPKTWAELRDLAQKLTIRENGKIRRGGIAIGNASNVDNFSDILGLLMLQNGANPADPTSQKAQEALQFYTDFYTQSRVWDATLPNSTVAFARGDAAMIIAPSWRIHEIRTQNPNITIGVAPVPQLGSTKTTWATYWAEGVSAQSKNKEASWKLLKFLSTPEALQKLHSDASKERSFGEIYPRVDMANMLADSPYAAAYLADAPYAKDWYMNSFTHDNGLNDQIIKYFEDAVTGVVNQTTSANVAMTTVSQGLLQILRQYNLTR